MYRLISGAAEGCPGGGPAHLLVESAAEIGFQWDSCSLGWERPGLPVLSNFAGPNQHFRGAVLDAWRNKVSTNLRTRKGFRGGPVLDIPDTLQLPSSGHVREREKALLWSVLVGRVWNLEKVQGQHVPCRFCGADIDGQLFWDCPLGSRPRCLLWHGWLPFLSGVIGGSPWAEGPADGGGNLLECALGPNTLIFFGDCRPPVRFHAQGAPERVAAEPVVSDGSMVEDEASGASSSGSGFFTYRSGHLWADRWWGHLDDDVGGNMAIGSCRGFCSVPGPLQTVQRAEFSRPLMALDNLGVVRHVGRLLGGNVGSRPAELVKDGDHILLIGRMLLLRVLDTVRITKVKGHADWGMVRDGRVREQDRVGNNAADEAADFGRRRFDFPVIDARWNYAGVCGRWYAVILTVHRFLLLSIMRMEVVLRLILWFGQPVLFQRDAGWCMV